MVLGGLVFKAHRLLYHSTLGLRVIKKKKDGLAHLQAQVGVARGAEEPPRDAERIPARGVEKRGALHAVVGVVGVEGSGCRVV